MPPTKSRIVGIVRIDDDAIVDWLFDPGQTEFDTSVRPLNSGPSIPSESRVLARLPQLRDELHSLFVDLSTSANI